MEEIVWTEDFSVGVALLDEQHQRIVSLINKIIAYHGQDIEEEVIEEALKTMNAYAKEHFRTEEGLLLEHAYPDYKAHAEQHKAYVKKTFLLSTENLLESETTPQKLKEYLIAWWKEHILVCDMKYKSFFEEKGVL